MKEIKRILFFIGIVSVFLFPHPAFLQEEIAEEHEQEMVVLEKCGGTVTLQKQLEEKITIEEITPDTRNGISIPKDLKLLSTLCLIDAHEKISYDTTQGMQLTLPNLSLTKHISFFYWDGNQKKWFTLPSIKEDETTLSVLYYQPHGIIGVFHNLRESREGVASWYKHSKTPQGAATNYFPLGTKLKVTNLENNKSIIVTITSTWTQKNPKRVIDIEKTGFKKLGLVSQGLIRVRLEKFSEEEIQGVKPKKKNDKTS